MAPEEREALKRLGGGRWETRDGRFTIEPESGTWVVVDSTATDELGLPLVIGPFSSLTAAREAIDDVRERGPATSPLAAELERTRQAAEVASKAEPAAPRAEKAQRSRDAERPAPPPEPAWLGKLDPPAAKRARTLIRRLESAGVESAERIARDDVRDDDPAVARVAIERELSEIARSADSAREAVERAAALLVRGRDRELGVGWRLVDDDGREIGRLEP